MSCPALQTAAISRPTAHCAAFWLRNNYYFSVLKPNEQWQLHDYFKPDQDWTERQLLAHRATVTEERPSLPHQAGRALATFIVRAAEEALLRVRKARQPTPPQPVGCTNQRDWGSPVSVRSVVRPEPDLKKLVTAMAWHLAQQKPPTDGAGDRGPQDPAAA